MVPGTAGKCLKHKKVAMSRGPVCWVSILQAWLTVLLATRLVLMS